MFKFEKKVWGWALYDWANSAFATSVMAAFFPIFFKQYWSAGADVNLSTAKLGLANSLASLAVALIAPVLGAIADRRSAKKKFLIFFAYMGVIMTTGLYWVGQGQWAWAVILYVLATIGFSGANGFYDSLLPSVAREDQVDLVSGLGFSLGYLGGGLLFLGNVLTVLMPQSFGLADKAEAVKLAFISVALWWGLFTIFTLLWVPEEKATPGKRRGNPVADGVKQLLSTLKKARQLKTVWLFLLAYWFYIDGVDTVIRMAVDYGMSLGFDPNILITSLLIVQFVGFPAALVFGRLGQCWSLRGSIFVAIGVYIGVTLYGALMDKEIEFYILAVAIACVQGGIQALSRSYFTRLIPKSQAGEFYGFYNMLGKFAAILGPSLMGLMALAMRGLLMPAAPTPEEVSEVGRLATRWAMASVIILFVIGGVLFYFVDEEKGKKQAEQFESG